MINNFEDYTGQLSEEEFTIMKVMIPAFKLRKGADNAVTSIEITEKMEQAGYKRLNGARLRKIINYIRIHHLVPNLVASQKGYYVETDENKIRGYRESLLERANAIRAVAESFMQLSI
jgi:hypothetical protein